MAEEIVTESSKNDSIIVKLIQENDQPTDFIETKTHFPEFPLIKSVFINKIHPSVKYYYLTMRLDVL